MQFQFSELNHVAIHVRDLDRAIQFYTTVLDLPRLPRPPFQFPGAWFALGSQELHLIVQEDLPPQIHVNHHFALRVEDAHAAHAELQRRGVQNLTDPAPRPDGPIQVFFTDPDGYLIEIFSGYPQP